MFKFLNKTYIYNVSWEDPRMDQRVFNLDESDHVITIASAGCNVLDYIIEGSMVTAVDFNLCQIALTELKKVAIINCEFDVFFEIFSKSNMKLLREVYPTLRPFLSQPSAEFWDDGVHSIKSFMYSGTSGSMSFILFRVLFPLFGLGFIRNELIKPNASHSELLKKISNHSYGIRSLAWLMDNIMLRGGCCFAGVPERQMALGLHRPNNLAMVIERIFFKTDLVDDNYFYSGYFLGYYKETCCPRYLRRENYSVMKKHLMNNKLKLVHGTMLSAINTTTTPITVASLLDHMDWMTDRMINEEITHLINRMDPIKGKIFWRTFADDVHSAPLSWLKPDRVDDKDDRVGMYWTTWIADIKDCKVSYEERCDSNQSAGLLGDIVTGVKIVTAPFWKPFVASTLKETGHAKTMESFYKYQKDGYDAFREGLLLARPALMEAFPLKKEGNMIWVDVGGGTARNLEYFSADIIRKYFKSIYILDISTSLLEVAKKRIALMGLDDIVTIIEHDITNDSVLTCMKNAGIDSVDVITMSYSFSMIPKQQQAINNASKLLKKNGYLAIADFFLEGSYDYCLPSLSMHTRAFERRFQKTWFSFDNVHLLGEKELNMGSDTLEVEWDNRFRGSVPFLPFLQPYHGVYILRKK
jgi:ubiquinone/menaquinone biosynthesis C-methylase UbiE